MYQVPFPKLNNGGSPQWVALRVQSFSRCRSYPRLVYLSTYRMGNLFELLGDKTTKRKEKNPSPCFFHISWNFFSLFLARVVGDLWLFVPPSIRRLFYLSLRQQFPISELFDCLTFFFSSSSSSFLFLSFRME
jgi:hypothetical protein